ncbi:hypothetical protein E1B28_003544 [Marasmius oreades]|uniref:Uncharacterized protein n=1 Tax=Marasmius oreades TaxID=181124 RepID=A0A9P7RM64_9AGAR|nr:uncharacterized protein E1B28_003544 [Marasmius oreades]KAG7086022.1 hypothetical protein E1B28_003544 [Marasmius oreades]
MSSVRNFLTSSPASTPAALHTSLTGHGHDAPTLLLLLHGLCRLIMYLRLLLFFRKKRAKRVLNRLGHFNILFENSTQSEFYSASTIGFKTQMCGCLASERIMTDTRITCSTRAFYDDKKASDKFHVVLFFMTHFVPVFSNLPHTAQYLLEVGLHAHMYVAPRFINVSNHPISP